MAVDTSRHLRGGGDDSSLMPNWDLSGGMDKEEYVFLGCYAFYIIVVWILYWRVVMKPMKLLAVFVHEMGHAVAAWLTCGKVHSVTVLADESGLAVYQPGLRIVIYPAGYVGTSLFGAILICLSADKIGAFIAAGLMILAFVASLVWNPNKLVVKLSTAFLVLTVIAILVEIFAFDPFLEYVTLFYGVSFGYYAVKDVWDDCVWRTLEDSDAKRCSENLWPCCPPRLIGFWMLVLAVFLQILGLYCALVWLTSH